MEKEKLKKDKNTIRNLENYIEEKKFSEALEVLEHIPEAQRIQELKSFVERSIRKNLFITARYAVLLLPEPYKTEELKKIIDVYINGSEKSKIPIDLAQRMALLLQDKDKIGLLEKIVDKYLEKERLDDAKYTALLLPEPNRMQQLKKVEVTYLENGQFPSALQVALLFQEPDRTQELKKIEEKCIQKRLFEYAREIAFLLPEPYKTQELKKIAKEEKRKEFQNRD